MADEHPGFVNFYSFMTDVYFRAEILSAIAGTDRPTGHQLEMTAASVLEERRDCKFVTIDQPLEGDEAEDAAFRALGSCQSIRYVIIEQTERMGATEIEQALRKAIQTLPNLQRVLLQGFQVSSAEADRILLVLRTMDPTGRLSGLYFYVGNSFEETAHAIAQYVQKSSTLSNLAFRWHESNEEEEDVPVAPSEAAMSVLCEAIGQSKTLETLEIFRNPTSTPDLQTTPAKLLATAAAASTALRFIRIHTGCSRDFVNQFERALSHSREAKGFDFTRSGKRGRTIVFTLNRATKSAEASPV